MDTPTTAPNTTSTAPQLAVVHNIADQLPIVTAEPVAVPAGQQVVYFRRKKVAVDQAFRAVVVPQYAEMQVLPPLHETFAAAIAEAVESAASDILRSYVDANPHAVSISGAMLSFPSVLDQLAATQTSQRLNGDQIASWYDASETAKTMQTIYGAGETGDAKRALLRSKFVSLASNNSGVTVTQAVKMLSYLAEADLNSAVCKAVAKRLEKLSKADTSEDL